MSSVCCPGCGTRIPAPRFRYETQEERDAARLRTYRRTSRKRWLEYVALCDQLGAKRQKAWAAHLRELRLGPPESIPAKRVRKPKSVRPDYDFWLQKVDAGELTMDEIRVLGSGLTMFDVVSSIGPDASREGAEEVCAA